MTSIGYTATDIIDGIPYGTQAELAVASGSPRLFAAASAARRASYALAYSGFITNGVAGGGVNLGSAPRPPRYGPHAPLKSGTLVFDCPYTKVETNAADKTEETFFASDHWFGAPAAGCAGPRPGPFPKTRPSGRVA